MSNEVKLDQALVYKVIQKRIKGYDGPVEFGLVLADGTINVYTDRSIAMPILIQASGQPYTWAESFLEKFPNPTSEDYGNYVFDTLLHMAVRRGTKKDLPSRNKILKSKQMKELRTTYNTLDDLAIAKYIIFLAETNQTCKSCDIGFTQVEIGSYAEYHKCINCGYQSTVN